MRQCIGAARFVYNWALATWTEMYDAYKAGTARTKPDAVVLLGRWTKEKPEWASEVPRCVATQAVRQVGMAFKTMWRGLGKYPKFHKKARGQETFYADNAHAHINGKYVYLPRIGNVRMAEPLRYDGKIMAYTVISYAGQWHVAVRVEVSEDVRPECVNKSSVVGIDVGLKNIATASDGNVLRLPEKLWRLEKHLKAQQRRCSRAKHGSKNSQKQGIKRQRIQLRMRNIKEDAAHKFTTMIAKNHGIVVTETLDLKEMMRTASQKDYRRALGKSLMSRVLLYLDYKAQEHKSVPMFYPSSKRCSRCGHVKSNLSLSTRVYICTECGLRMDRDLNAACNLMQAGQDMPGVPVEAVSKTRTTKQEV